MNFLFHVEKFLQLCFAYALGSVREKVEATFLGIVMRVFRLFEFKLFKILEKALLRFESSKKSLRLYFSKALLKI